MIIRPLTATDAALYLAFRQEMWPLYAAAGDWDTVQVKYLQHPLAPLCPGSGLYAAVQEERIQGVMGAFPMPVTLRGEIHPGHMLVDWAVLPRLQGGPAAGRLWQALFDLPGRKFASIGSPASQGALSKRGQRIPSTDAVSIVRITTAAAIKLLGLMPYARPLPARLESLVLPPGVSVLPPESLSPPMPPDPATFAYVAKGPDYWRVYCRHRLQTGAVALRLQTGDQEAHLVLTLSAIGRLRVSRLMGLRLLPPSVQTARRIGRLLKRTLLSLGVGVISTEEADPTFREVMNATGVHVRRTFSYWWSIPKPGDAFAAQEVSWWLTAADRDSHWGNVQPFHLELP